MDPAKYTFPPEPRDGLTVNDFWTDNVPPESSPYWTIVRKVAGILKSDGCTGVKDYFLDACLEHDIHWRTGRTVFGVSITTGQANRRFRKVIQSRSRFGRFSPMSWWRWAGVSIGAKFLKHESK